MKKKFGLWLNIVTICLCVCAIAIGVYAATSATLTVSGQVGFQAHGVDMTITGQLSGYVLSTEQDTATQTRTRTLNTVTLGGESKITKGTMSFADSTNTETGTDVYFTDLVLDENGNVPSIVLTLTLTNTSLFQVEATIDVSVLSTAEITATADQTNLIFDARDGENATLNLTITFTLEDPENSITTEIDLSDVTTPIISFEKYIFSVRSMLEFDETYGYYIEMGKDPETQTALRWFPFAYSSDGTTFAAHTLSTNELTAGSYYFISEYVLMKSVWGTKNESSATKGFDYGTESTIQSIVNGVGEGSVYATYNLSEYAIYDLITKRQLVGEDFKYYVLDPGMNVVSSTSYPTNTIQDQTLWLLSCKNPNEDSPEISFLASKNETSPISIKSKNLSGTFVSWWLRSPYGYDSMDAYWAYNVLCVGDSNYDGEVESQVTEYAVGVRPAFQITIG